MQSYELKHQRINYDSFEVHFWHLGQMCTNCPHIVLLIRQI